MTDAANIGSGDALAALELIRRLAEIDRPSVIEVGTLRSDPEFPTHHTAWAPHGTWLRCDAYPGQDVDEIVDAHEMLGFANYDAYVACSVFEHLQRPWVAMQAAADVVSPGGLVYVQTHQTFPLHGYPSDYFRFSKEALAGIMEDAGLQVLHAGYLYPCKIVPPPEVTRWNTAPDVEAWLNVEALGIKE